MLERLELFFKPETRKSGRDYFADGAVFISSGSDTQIQAFVKASGSVRVSFTSESISAVRFSAKCSCPAATNKDQFCKHMWAVLLQMADKFPDFLECKTAIEKASPPSPAAGLASGLSSSTRAVPSASRTAAAAASAARAEEMKTKQADYRKQQYQKQKERVKAMKPGKKHASAAPAFPEDVSKALQFFSDNGFDLAVDLNGEALSTARKKLSRIFHPDKGGSHDEALILNENFSIVEDYLISLEKS